MKLENLGNAFEEVKEIIRQKGAIFARQLKSISQEFDVTEAAIQASFVRETGHSVFDYKIQKEPPLTRARQIAKIIRTTRDKDYWEIGEGLPLKTFASATWRKHVFIGTWASKVLLHDLIEVASGELVSLSTAELRRNFRTLYDRLVNWHPHLEEWL